MVMVKLSLHHVQEWLSKFYFFTAVKNFFYPFKAADDAKWDQWQDWGTCSSTTGLGTQTRTHSCNSLGCASSNDCTSFCSDGFELVISGSNQMCIRLQEGRSLFKFF